MFTNVQYPTSSDLKIKHEEKLLYILSETRETLQITIYIQMSAASQLQVSAASQYIASQLQVSVASQYVASQLQVSVASQYVASQVLPVNMLPVNYR